MPVRKKPILVQGPEFAAIRAFRAESKDEELRRQFAFFGAEHRPARHLASALRAERRAARSGKGYDISRHFALMRFLRREAAKASTRPDPAI